MAIATQFAALRLTIDCKLESDPDSMLRTVGRLSIERHASQFRCVEFHDSIDGPSELAPLFDSMAAKTAGEAWTSFVDSSRDADLCLFVGPGIGPVVFSDLAIEAAQFQVFDAADGEPRLIGKPWHRFEAMAMAKRILAGGGCPIVVSFHLVADDEWDSTDIVSVEGSPESIEAT
ncbi:hypothetical protein Poly24_06640 [Rosistilla carotiformis]|uniref:Uncharacterized protein n=1 Tax=Rosistilla carotiformis TaxID=2528017 RepID=A0A518JN36_9BACT|nr:hypothetical protein [Rosistilla carotiformis]QDV66974.1 hypothetical protein Poly24_06640 [Rosistilla carotiformis]